MTVLITTNPAIFDEIGYLTAIEGGLGPVKIGVPLSEPEGVPNRRFAVCHPWVLGDPDTEWARIYGNPDITVAPSLPADWRYPREV